MSTFPSQFAEWLTLAERDGLGGLRVEPPAIRRGRLRDLELELPEDEDYGDWTAGTFTARLRAAPGAGGPALAEYTCVTQTPSGGKTRVRMTLEGGDQTGLPASDPADGYAEVFFELDYAIGDIAKPLIQTRQLVVEVI